MAPAGRRRNGLASARRAAGYTQETLAAELYIDRSTVIRWEAGDHRPLPYIQPKLARLLGRSQEQLSELLDGRVERLDDRRQALGIAAVDGGVAATPLPRNDIATSNTVDDQGAASSSDDDEAAALELSRRVAASDVGNETLTQFELVFDDLAIAYPVTPPQQLLQRLRRQLSYVSGIMDVNKTLDEHRRLVAVGAWLSLLAATVHVDLEQQAAATARLRTAASLARHAGHDEIRAWCFETEAWRLLTNGGYRQAVDLSRAAQELAPAGSSVAIQATAQEGRAWARLGQPRETYEAVERVNRLVAPLKRPDQSEHYYRYDPDKSVAYVATTLAWLGDPAAEGYAREVIARLQLSEDSGKWPRRLAAANLDLALTLLATHRLDEACDATLQAIQSGRVVPSNHWRAAEVVSAVEARQVPEAKQLREAYEELRRGPHRPQRAG